MKLNWANLDADVLNRLYLAREKELEAAILRGGSWEEVSIHRKALSELSTAIHTKVLQNSDEGASEFPSGPGDEI
jgi:hypothetical protein